MLRRVWNVLWRCACAALACSLSRSDAADPFPAAALPGVSLNQSIRRYEPSDLVWHTRLNRLYSVSDGSAAVSARVFSLATDGTGVAYWPVVGDLEAICIADPTSDFLYVGTEQPNQIKEFRISTGVVTRTFDLDQWMWRTSGQGLEALTFVPDASSAEGGRFYAGLQDDGTVFSFSLPILTSETSTAVTFLGSFNPVPGLSDLSGLDYERTTGVLYAIYDTANLMRATTLAGGLLKEWTLPGKDQEGIAFVGDDLFIAEDSGDIVRYSPFQAVPEPAGLVTAAAAVAAAWLRFGRRAVRRRPTVRWRSARPAGAGVPGRTPRWG